MKLHQYNKIIGVIITTQEGNPMSSLVEQFPEVDRKTLGSIWSQEMQKKVKRNFHQINAAEKATEIYNRYLSSVGSGAPPGILLEMARCLDYSPAMLAKLILEHYLIQRSSSTQVSKSQVNSFLRDTTLIEDRDLSFEVYLCVLQDDVYGPFADCIKHAVGHEYEFHLCRELDKLNIGYYSEDELRSRGYDKTPDIKLHVPIAVEGHVINWIESKASFGDEESHRGYLRDQFWSYWNRFGSGLVIYWLGFVDEIDQHSDKGILIRSSLPTDITFMDPLLLTPRQ
ncbi:hypothetical protein Pmani_023136 [Petrolisthes manimaculis]|uniref:CDAN1-interacting nuclease 1 n=1 Tax=Petrolisthes manimaculis TaxID=1843537 RepID=A0AAE1PCJ5_9EUCA|nr:hypothetical protein Pmani_023136 [Petrolisthes manimaculis]